MKYARERCTRLKFPNTEGKKQLTKVPLFTQLVLNTSVLAKVLKNLSHSLRAGERQSALHGLLSFPGLTRKPSAESEDIAIAWA